MTNKLIPPLEVLAQSNVIFTYYTTNTEYLRIVDTGSVGRYLIGPADDKELVVSITKREGRRYNVATVDVDFQTDRIEITVEETRRFAKNRNFGTFVINKTKEGFGDYRKIYPDATEHVIPYTSYTQRVKELASLSQK